MKKVAAYCRVSTDNEDQANSLSSQKSYFERYINDNKDWQLIEIYADEGLSGTSTRKRKAFNKMICDAENGKINLILTKEISRFARNTLDSIYFTRKLKDLGIGVIFLNDNINTLDADSELRLTIMSSIAQEESRKTSDRVKWGQRRQMEKGVAFGASVFGYDYHNGKLSINEREAKIVHQIFHMYLEQGKGLNRIAKELEEQGVLTKRKGKVWSANSISRLLKNEKYCGDLVQQKTYTSNYLTKERKVNKDKDEWVVIQNNHEPIVERNTFDKTQLEIAKRTNIERKSPKYSNRYAFSGKLECGMCGHSCISRNKVESKGDNRATVYRWQCSNKFKYGLAHETDTGKVIGCNNALVREEILQHVFMLAVKEVVQDPSLIIDSIVSTIEIVLKGKRDAAQNEQKELLKQLNRLENKKQESIELFLERIITKDDLKTTTEKLDKQIQVIHLQSKRFEDNKMVLTDYARLMQTIKNYILGIFHAETFSEELCKSTLHKIVIHSKTKFDVYLL